MNSLSQTEIEVLSGGAVQGGLVSLAEAFRGETGHKVAFTFATAPVLRRKVESQEASPDIIVAPAPMMKEFEKSGLVVAGSSAVIGSVKAGVVVRRGAREPDVASADAFKKEIIACESLVYNEGSSGIFVEKLLERLGVAEEARAKTIRFPDAGAVMRHLAASKTPKEIGFGQITAILLHADTGVKLVGPLPKEIENVTTYAAGLAAGAKAPQPAKGYIRFLLTPSAKATFKAMGVD